MTTTITPVQEGNEELELVESLQLVQEGGEAVKELGLVFYHKLVNTCAGLDIDTVTGKLDRFELAYRQATEGWYVNYKKARIPMKMGNATGVWQTSKEIEGNFYHPLDMKHAQCIEIPGNKRLKIINAQLPGAYRSAKTAILKAVSLDKPLLDENGEPVGKTALEKSCRIEKTPDMRMAEAVASIIKAAGEIGALSLEGVAFTSSQQKTVEESLTLIIVTPSS